MNGELTLQERVRRFNLGTPTAMHVRTHELVNDLWRELKRSENRVALHPAMLKALQIAEVLLIGTPENEIFTAGKEAIRATIAAAVGDRPEAAQPPIQREGETS